MTDRMYFEDFRDGMAFDLGAAMLSEAQIVAFAQEFDPQPFHLDRAAAEATPLGGLAASGWQTCALGMRLLYDGLLARVDAMGSPGVAETLWRAPVRPEAPILGRVEIESARASKSKPDRGLIAVRYTLTQSGVDVCVQRFTVLIRRRQPGAAPAEAPKARAPEPPLDLSGVTTPEASFTAIRLEDAAIGALVDLGEETLTAEAIIGFARQYDPQPFHLDEAAGRASVFGGLAASGWHTTALWMRRMIAARMKARAALPEETRDVFDASFGPSPGFEALEWRRPVLAGDRLRFFSRVTESRAMRSRPGWGLLFMENLAVNQRGETAMRFLGKVMMRTE